MSHDPKDSLSRFMHGIYAHYSDKGIGSKKAKGRMIDETLQTVRGFIDKEQEIPDHLLVLVAQAFSQSLHHRGKKITTETISTSSGSKEQESHLVALRQLKDAKDATDLFITTYKGV